jgi:RHS repeat-associated protein
VLTREVSFPRFGGHRSKGGYGVDRGRGEEAEAAPADRSQGKTGLTTVEREELARLSQENRELRKGGVTYRLITDQVGSVRLVMNTSTGAVAERVDYDEFGNVLADSAPGTQPFGFAGGLYDRDTGLVRFGARDYDPSTGRWAAVTHALEQPTTAER